MESVFQIDEGAYLRDSEGSMCMETLQSWLSLFLTELLFTERRSLTGFRLIFAICSEKANRKK